MVNENKIITLAALCLIVVMCLGMFYLGRKSVSIPQPIEVVSDTVWLDLPPIHDTITVPGPVKVIPPDTVYYPVSQPVDTAALYAVWLDYYSTREYDLDFSSDTTGVFRVAAKVNQNKIQEAISTVRPRVQVVTNTQTVYKERAIQPWIMVGTSKDFKFQQVQGGVDLGGKWMVGISGFRYEKELAVAFNAGIKF